MKSNNLTFQSLVDVNFNNIHTVLGITVVGGCVCFIVHYSLTHADALIGIIKAFR